jgi:hypothetical protein
MTLEVIAMLNRLLLGAGLTIALAACASTPPPQPTQTAAAKAPTGCVPETATRIPASNPNTCAGFGHSWTQQDISRTGQPDPGAALRMLDPSMTVSGH